MPKFLTTRLAAVVLFSVMLTACSGHTVSFVAGSATGAFLASQLKHVFK